MAAIPLILYIVAATQKPAKLPLCYVPFSVETFFPIDLEELQKNQYLVTYPKLKSVSKVFDRFVRKGTKPNVDKLRMRFHFKIDSKTYQADADGNIDVAGVGGKIPEAERKKLDKGLVSRFHPELAKKSKKKKGK